MPPKDAAAPGAPGGACRNLNNLPERALIRVLGHLEAREAVRTYLISKRWRDLWVFTGRLDIRQPCGCRSGDDADQRQAQAKELAAFVKNLLLRRRQSVLLDTLLLCWSHPVPDGDADTWIAHAVGHGAKEIELSGEHHAEDPLLGCASFQADDYTLTLGIIRLKTVRLIHVRLDDTSLAQRCSERTRLEELELRNCLVKGKPIHSTSTTLERLHMIDCTFVDGFNVSSKNLASLRCIRPVGYVPSIQNMERLVRATISLDDLLLNGYWQWVEEKEDRKDGKSAEDLFAQDGFKDSADNKFARSDAEESDDTSKYYDSEWSGPSDDEGDDSVTCYTEIADEHRRKPYKYLIHASALRPRDDCSEKFHLGGSGIVCSLSNVETMVLLARPGEIVLMRELKSCPDFNNLKTLSLGEWCITPQLDALASILNYSPNLEELFLHLDLAFESRLDIGPLESSFACPNLKRVMIRCCTRDMMVHTLAEFFRENGIANEKIFVQRTAEKGGLLDRAASSSGAKGDAGSWDKRKVESEAEKRDAKQRKAGN